MFVLGTEARSRPSLSGGLGILVLCFALSASAVDSESEVQPDSSPGLDEIVVRADRTEKRLLEVPAAVSFVSQEQIQLARPRLTLGESLAQVPGVFSQNRQNFSQDLRISIRGFGSRARFGLRGVRLIVDDIPATLPDGQGQVDTLQFSTVGRIEVLRGPSTSLYGSAAGGVIRIESDPIPAEPEVSGRAAAGSNGYQSYDIKSLGRSGSVGFLLGLSRQQMGGYREHSHMENNVLNSRLEWEINEDSDLMALFGFTYAPIAQDPGGLKQSEVESNRKAAAPNNLKYDAGERLNQLTSGLRYRLRWAETQLTTATAWAGRRDFKNKIAGGPDCPKMGVAGQLDRIFAGGSLQHQITDPIWDQANTFLIGIDIEAQRDERERRCNTGTSLTPLTLNQSEDVTSFRGFIQDDLHLPWDLALEVSVGFDFLRYEVEDHLTAGAGNSGQEDYTEVNPAASLLWSPSEKVNPYLRISTSFEPPTTTELRNPAGTGFNPSLEPQRSVNYEVGVKGVLAPGWFYETAVYRIESKNELLPYEISDQTFYRNAGRTHRTGIEVGVRADLAPGLSLIGAYTFSRAEFDAGESLSGQNLAGNQVPGVPEQHLYIQLEYLHNSGVFAAAEGRYIGSFFADDANTVETESYGIVDLRAGWKLDWGNWEVVPYLAVLNLFDEDYNDNVRINASYGRYYEPAPGTEIQGGLGFSYRF